MPAEGRAFLRWQLTVLDRQLSSALLCQYQTVGGIFLHIVILIHIIIIWKMPIIKKNLLVFPTSTQQLLSSFEDCFVVQSKAE